MLPKRQKIMGLKTSAGKAAADDCLVKDLKVKSGQKLMMLGTPEELISATNEATADGGVEIADDFQMKEDLLEQLQPHEDPDVMVCTFSTACERCLLLHLKHLGLHEDANVMVHTSSPAAKGLHQQICNLGDLTHSSELDVMMQASSTSSTHAACFANPIVPGLARP